MSALEIVMLLAALFVVAVAVIGGLVALSQVEEMREQAR